MAAERDGVAPPAHAPPACLCVLCGLPAAGKSTLSRHLCSTAAQRGWRSAVVRYDDLIPEQLFQPREAAEEEEEEEEVRQQEHTDWRSHRQAVLQCIECVLQKPDVSSEPPGSFQINRAEWERCFKPLLQLPTDDSGTEQGPLLFLLDDNFYYPSMRYEVFQLARKYSLGFCQLYLHCPLELCVSRNQSRPKPIPSEVIVKMATHLDPPNPQKNMWERKSISLNTSDGVCDGDIQRVMDLISSALCEPLSPLEDNTQQKEADREKCASSVVHQADQACRRLVSEAMKAARENQVPPERMRSMANQLNESKARFLHNLRTQFLQETALTQEEIDVRRVVQRAVDTFDCEKKEILLKIMSDHS